jgi:hypothetical protein
MLVPLVVNVMHGGSGVSDQLENPILRDSAVELVLPSGSNDVASATVESVSIELPSERASGDSRRSQAQVRPSNVLRDFVWKDWNWHTC